MLQKVRAESGDSKSLADRLRSECRELHERAEGSAFQQRLVRGEMTLATYRDWLAQLLIVHETLERVIRNGLLVRFPEFGVIIDDSQFIAEHIIADLQHTGGIPAPIRHLEPTDQIVHSLQLMNADDRRMLTLFGMHYVIEGAKNGNRFAARSIRKALQLPSSGEGTRSLDPYGDEQPARWMTFRRAVSELRLDQCDQDQVVHRAQLAFEFMIDLSESFS